MLKLLDRKKIEIALIVYWIILLGATSFPTTAIPSMGVSDKFMHFTAYFVLGVLLNLTLVFQTKYQILKKYNFLFTIFIGSVYGVIDEVHQ